MKKVKPPVKTHGAKLNLSNWIIENLPENYEQLTYVEPMCSGASIFLNKNPSKEEVLSDLDRGLITIFKSLRDEPKEFIDKVKRIRATERVFKMAQNKAETGFEDYVELAFNEFLLRRLSRNGQKKTFISAESTSWKKVAEELNLVAQRVKNCTILNNSALEIFKVWDEEDTFFYLDPPYLPNAREENIKPTNEPNMSVEEHIQLLDMVKNARGKVMISNQSSPLYNRSLKGWKTKKNTMSVGKDNKIEVIWMNY